MYKKFVALSVAIITALSAVVFFVGYYADREMEKTVSDQFNSQQLILARKISSDIRQHFHFLKTSLLGISHIWEQDVASGDDPWKDAGSSLDMLKAWDVLTMGHTAKDGKEPEALLDEGVSPGSLGVDFSPYLEWARKAENRGKVLIGETLRPDAGPFKGFLITVMATPTYLIVHEAGAIRGTYFSGLNFFLVDAVGVATRYSWNVRSGKTGYAWIIDQNGIFLAHHEQEFVGRSSFTVRSERNPDISFERINRLVEDHLLRGEEGTSWYISGWHLGMVGKLKKLLAYSPIFLDGKQRERNLWSVGVVAPADEVSTLLRSILFRQWVLAGLFLGLIFVVMAFLLAVSLHWSETLKAEVDRKTEDLRRSEVELRSEHDQLKAGMAQLVEAQERVIHSERLAAIGEAAAHLSHEIKNPLMLIGGFARQVLRSLPNGDCNIQKLQIIQDEIQRLERMLNDVRDFTRPSRPQKELRTLNECVRETLDLMESALFAQMIEVEAALRNGAPPVSYDPRQIKQVLINILKNAMEAMPTGGKLTIASGWDHDSSWVSIADTGDGIPEAVRKKLFLPFFTTKRAGTGLGLAVCNRIIQDHRGEIRVEAREGVGTRFIIFLPLGPDDPEIVVDRTIGKSSS
jgi:two-component system sensor histidine kinase HydH